MMAWGLTAIAIPGEPPLFNVARAMAMRRVAVLLVKILTWYLRVTPEELRPLTAQTVVLPANYAGLGQMLMWRVFQVELLAPNP